jgi:hypothetical protein
MKRRTLDEVASQVLRIGLQRAAMADLPTLCVSNPNAVVTLEVVNGLRDELN